MAHFTRFEAEQVREIVVRDYPQLIVHEVLDLTDEKTGEYQWSFFSIGFGQHPFMTHIASRQDWTDFLDCCEVVALVREDLRQEAYTCKNCGIVVDRLYYGLCEDCSEGWEPTEEEEADIRERVFGILKEEQDRRPTIAQQDITGYIW